MQKNATNISVITVILRAKSVLFIILSQQNNVYLGYFGVTRSKFGLEETSIPRWPKATVPKCRLRISFFRD